MVRVDNFAKDILKKMNNFNGLGQIYKATSNAYWVHANGQTVKCVARGVLKIKGEDLCVGDYVAVENGAIISVEERNNKFIRPKVSNVDLIVAVLSCEPKPDFLLVDKLCINAVKEGVELVFVVNKSDLDDKLFEYINSEYGGLGFNVISVSSKTGDGIKQLKSILSNKLSVLAGQSAVGKTSIVNALFGLDLKIGDLSDKIMRGKHTTTRSEIFECDNIRLVDSPGFAVIDAMVELDELPDCYPEYVKHATMCKFRGCTHISEPNCQVKNMVEQGVLSKERYERYKEIYLDLSKRRKNYE